MATGTLIAESLVVGGALEGLDVTVRGIERVEPQDISAGQRAAGQTDIISFIAFAGVSAIVSSIRR